MVLVQTKSPTVKKSTGVIESMSRACGSRSTRRRAGEYGESHPTPVGRPRNRSSPAGVLEVVCRTVSGHAIQAEDRSVPLLRRSSACPKPFALLALRQRRGTPRPGMRARGDALCPRGISTCRAIRGRRFLPKPVGSVAGLWASVSSVVTSTQGFTSIRLRRPTRDAALTVPGPCACGLDPAGPTPGSLLRIESNGLFG